MRGHHSGSPTGENPQQEPTLSPGMLEILKWYSCSTIGCWDVLPWVTISAVSVKKRNAMAPGNRSTILVFTLPANWLPTLWLERMGLPLLQKSLSVIRLMCGSTCGWHCGPSPGRPFPGVPQKKGPGHRSQFWARIWVPNLGPPSGPIIWAHGPKFRAHGPKIGRRSSNLGSMGPYWAP